MRFITIQLTLILLLIIPYTISANNDETFIDSYEYDISGDHAREYIRLTGRLLASNSDYFISTSLYIKNKYNHSQQISLLPGYHPSLQLIDLNHDHTLDIFYAVAKDKAKKEYDYYMFSYIGEKVTEIPLPKLEQIKGSFIDNFQAEVIYDYPPKKLLIPLQHYKQNLIDDRLYTEEGKLKKKKYPLEFQQIKLTPIYIEGKNKMGLKSYTNINGLHQQNKIGQIETIWLWQNGRWITLQNKVRINQGNIPSL